MLACLAQLAQEALLALNAIRPVGNALNARRDLVSMSLWAHAQTVLLSARIPTAMERHLAFVSVLCNSPLFRNTFDSFSSFYKQQLLNLVRRALQAFALIARLE